LGGRFDWATLETRSRFDCQFITNTLAIGENSFHCNQLAYTDFYFVEGEI
jgi:hypothetical protein